MAREEWFIQPGESRIIDIDDVRALKVALVGGHVDVVGHDEPGARVEVHGVTGKSLKVVVDNGRLSVDHPQISWENFIDVFRWFKGGTSADVSIAVPRSVRLNFGIVTAEGLVTGLENKASVSTVSGALVVDACSDELTVNAVSGEVTVSDHDGAVWLHTVSGDATVSGSIDELTTDSVSGDLYADLRDVAAKVRMNSVSGNLTVRIPATPVEYRVSTVTGRLRLGDQEFRGIKGGFTGRFGAAEGIAIELRANTVSGDVSVLPARVPAAPAAESLA